MELKPILIAIVVVIALYLLYQAFGDKATSLSKMQQGNKAVTLAADTLPASNNTSNYTYSVWFFVNDWNYRYGEPKIILGRLDKDKNPSPSITLGAIQNNLNLSVACYPSKKSGGEAQIHNCNIDNVPIQRWVNLLISLNGRTLDVYLDGKLVRTCVLPGIAKVNADAPIYITPSGGFSGWTSNIQYWSDSTNPQQAWNIYKAGYGGSLMGNLFNKYRIKVAFLQDNVEQSSFEI